MISVLLTGATALLTGPLLFPTSPTPDELRRDRLPADVDLVMHLDFEGLRQTELWKRLSALEGELDIDELSDIERDFGIDPLTDVRALTLFKVESEEEPTVVLFSSTSKVDAALAKLQKEPGYRSVVRAGIPLHTFGDKHSREGEEDLFAYVHSAADERVVVLAQNEASALRAARVLRGEDPSHAKAGVGLALAPQKGSFLYLAASEIPHLDEIPPASQVFGLAQGIQVDLGEAGGLLTGHMGVHTASSQDAFDVSNILNGLVSMARLAREELGEAFELLTGLRIATRASEVTVDFEFDVARLFEIVEGLSGFRMDEAEGR